MKSFLELKLNESLVDALKIQGIETPSEIQRLSIPYILKNEDVIGESYTGSGKTIAFVLPILNKLTVDSKDIQSLILAPTHELVMQIENQIKLILDNSNVNLKSFPIIGDVNIEKQIKKLKENKPNIIVGTPGRVLDLIKKKKIKAHTIKTIVIDEGDNLLNNTNSRTIKDIIKCTLKERQILLFSATVDAKVLGVAKDIMNSPIILKNSEKVSINPNIEHMYIETDSREKVEVLRKIIASIKPDKALVFINKGYETSMITEKLAYHNINVLGIHGKSSKEERQKALESFRKGKVNILVSSDISARGLDIKDITHIINLDFPSNKGDYLHRVGRTGRMGKSGCAISLVTDKEKAAIRIYERDFGIKIEKKKISHGEIRD